MSTTGSNNGSPSKTKEWLKNQLVTHGIPLPSASAKKEEYQRLYEEQVLPNQVNSEFSSDDDTEATDDAPNPSPSKPASVNNQDDGEYDKKHSQFVSNLSDRNLGDALAAIGRDHGPIVASTRPLYGKILLEALKTDEKKTYESIKTFLAENQDARDHWVANGVDANGHSATNGNSENGFSDTDDDEALETASRASRSSRASSKRRTPVPSTGNQTTVKTSTPHRISEPKQKTKRVSGGLPQEDESLNDDESDSSGVPSFQSLSRAPSTSSSASSEPLLFPRVVAPPPASRVFKSTSSFSARRSMFESMEGRGAIPEDSRGYAPEDELPVPPKKLFTAANLAKYLVMLLTMIGLPLLAYCVYEQYSQSTDACVGAGCKDELDQLLEKMQGEEDLAQGPK